MISCCVNRYQSSQGAALVVALILLLIMTLIGVASMQSTGLEEKMSGNIREMNVALQSAETAIREAENTIEGLANTSAFGGGGGLYDTSDNPDPFTAATWTGSSSITATTNVGNSMAPRYFIELVGDFTSGSGAEINIFNYGEASETPITVFRIVARGTGATGTAQVILEIYYGRRF